MLSFLKNHPFAVQAFFESSIVLTFAVPKEKLQSLIPECLTLDTYDDKWAFLAIAVVKTKRLRLKGFPDFLGNDFTLIGYRVFVRYTNKAGKKLRGLYILKSETNKKKMELLGNIFTHYRYSFTDIEYNVSNSVTNINSRALSIGIQDNNEQSLLPHASPFTNWKDARKFAGPLPFTFTFNRQRKEVLIIEGVRSHWTPKPVYVTDCRTNFFDSIGVNDYVLASAFEIRNIPYYWKKGEIEQWKT